ncbi:ATP-binding cassette domain-containing protein [Lachnotalea sp. AF33-28]|uniref:ATP-binding cassette domain-containing protein n=1 Tax=Lachnotalea sp. AF33-28 TaxID=2292046 RepID=UPI001314E2D0|nr:ATP-binding cassette domain-containing protein [Lachnotalea sp. AF33-28]
MMFELHNITKKFGADYALRNVTSEIGEGLNFLVGSSGSGKTTLLKIISGMEPEFEGEVFFQGNSMKTMPDAEKSALYNNVFGFVWQDFNLLDDRTVLENVLLPRYLKDDLDEKRAIRTLRELGIDALANQKAGKLSGGQKQRVAIARELMKDPKVILADEPTSALDQGTAKEIMAILRKLSKKCTVIVVTHDVSLIGKGDKVYELDKGELISQPEKVIQKVKPVSVSSKSHLNGKGAFRLAYTSFRRQTGRTVASVLSLIAASVLLLTSVSGAITGSGDSVFDELFASYGESLLDISLYSSFMSAGGSNGEELDGPKADVSQNLDGLFERYREDERVEHVLFAQAFGNIRIGLDGQSYKVETTNNAPVFRKLAAGQLPMGDRLEIAVPEVFVKNIGMTNEEILGKEIEFSGTVFNWESGQPVETPLSCSVTVVGVVDSTMITEYGGQIYETPIGDSFFFSPAALASMREEADMEAQPGNFYIRCKTPADVISVKDELNAEGIVPLGRFELIEDMVRMNQQTAHQSGTAMWVIGLLALVVVLTGAVLTGVLRRREFAIEKASGFASVHLAGMVGAESLLQSSMAAILFLTASPLLNLCTAALWSADILSAKLLGIGVLLCFLLGLISLAVTAVIAHTVKPQNCLRTGDR